MPTASHDGLMFSVLVWTLKLPPNIHRNQHIACYAIQRQKMGIQYNTHEPMLELIMVPWVVTAGSVEIVTILRNDRAKFKAASKKSHIHTALTVQTNFCVRIIYNTVCIMCVVLYTVKCV
jgi:hypothetical protein